MSRLTAVTDVIRRLQARLFPERQLYFRANGVVRFIAISPRWQMAGVAAVTAFSAWVAVASVNLIFQDQILAAKNRQLDEMTQSYRELEASMQRLQAEVVATTERLKERQNYFRQFIDEVAQTPPAEPDASAGRGKTAPLSFTLQSLESELASLEDRQRHIAGHLLGLTNDRLDAMESVLSDTGLSKDHILGMVDVTGGQAQGGPLQAMGVAPAPSYDLMAVSASRPDPFAELLLRQSELQELGRVLQNAPFDRPVQNYYISSRFGSRSDPMTRRRAMHYGVDMAGWWKSPIHVTADGVVTKAGRNGAYGNFVEVDHGNGFRTRYGHLRSIKVNIGDRLERGAVVGVMGSTGRSTGTHLHYEIWFADRPLDPIKFFEAADDVRKIQNTAPALAG